MEHAQLRQIEAEPQPSELSLSDVLAHRSSVLWHEAVGVVLGVADAVGDAKPAAVPSPEEVHLATDGTIRVAGHPTGHGETVSQLRAWLKQLLEDTPTPPPLADLADDDASAPTVQEFVQALHYFSRPNRQEELASLARRIQAERQVAPIEQELAALTAKISQPKNTAAEKNHRRGVPWFLTLVAAMGRHRIILLAAVGVLLALAFPVVVSRMRVEPAPLPADRALPPVTVVPRVEGPAETRATETAEPPPSYARSTAPAQTSRLPVRPPNPLAPPVPPPVRSKALLTDLTLASPQTMPGEAVAVDRGIEGEPEVEAPAPPPTVAPDPVRVFTPDDVGVVQPVLLSSSLPTPSAPGASASSVTVVDLVIDERGHVARAMLASPEVRFEERMLLSAVKAWRFRPATKDGVPVRYRARISLTF